MRRSRTGAAVVELVDTPDLGSGGAPTRRQRERLKNQSLSPESPVRVQDPPAAPTTQARHLDSPHNRGLS
jgi:hypothetical protein